MEIMNNIIDFITDPSGLGLPIFIAVGLGVILYMMKYTTKEWRKIDKKQEVSKEKYRDISKPFKPF